MRTCTLLLRLAAPLQSWDIESKFNKRRTGREPSKSGVIGLIAAAMGIRRNEDEKLAVLADMRFGIRVDREGALLRDYQIVKLKKSDYLMHPYYDESIKDADYVTHRYYLSDAAFVVGLESNDETLLQNIENALKQPVFPLFLGRRSCPPVGRLCLGIKQLPLEEALKEGGEEAVRYVLETNPEEQGVLLRDQPISFNPQHRKYAFRQVREIINIVKDEPIEHDPMAELE